MASCADASAFVREAVGKPYCQGGNGPDAYDCWGLARDCQSQVFGRALPAILVDVHNLRALIQAVENHPVTQLWPARPAGAAPAHGDVVTMTQASHEHHVGVWLELGRERGVLHAVEGLGVCFDSLRDLRLSGWSRIVFREYAGP